MVNEAKVKQLRHSLPSNQKIIEWRQNALRNMKRCPRMVDAILNQHQLESYRQIISIERLQVSGNHDSIDEQYQQDTREKGSKSASRIVN